MIRGKRLSFILLLLVTPVIIYFLVWFFRLDQMVNEKFANKSFLKPTQFYSNTLDLQLGQNISEKTLTALLEKNNYRQKNWGSVLQKSDYSVGHNEECEKILSESRKCYAFFHHISGKINIVGNDESDQILVLLEVDPENQASRSITSLSMFPRLFAQYLGSSPVIQEQVPLNHIPRECLDAALSIEDTHFLEHQGVSFPGLARAMWVNLKSLKFAQGGSTITQQLVKNYFLTSERSLSRKVREMLLAFVVEWRIPKDQILETYLNIIYMGQQGNFQVRGYPAASRFYFKKDVSDLNLSECALLGAIINSPGRYNPFSKKENALERRKKVLLAMLDSDRILKEDYERAQAAELPTKSEVEIKETAPYFIEGVVRELHRHSFDDLSGYKIYTTLDLNAQAVAQQAVQTQLNHLESSATSYHAKNKSHSLQSVLLSSDPLSGDVLALVGGRDHRMTPFNRVFDSHRQVGSIFKPLVYLTAFYEKEDFTPMTLLDNSAFKYEYEGQTWEPHNYDKSTSNPVPAFYALKESLNIPTAHLGIDVGLSEVVSVAQNLGIVSPLKPLPALSLGAFEATPFEILQVYTNIARLGNTLKLHLVKKVENTAGDVIYTPSLDQQQVLSPEDFVTLSSILREAMRTGTGQGARARGFTQQAAGKTGTTSDYKDAWFAGYTANHTAIVWIGYDDNTPLRLSGSSGALPIWTEYMKAYTRDREQPDFKWDYPDLETIDISTEDLLELGIPPNKALPTQLIYYKK
jgi:penicillin-binding protein 1B